MMLCYVHNDGVSDHWACKHRSIERCSELILSEDRPEVVRVDYCIVTISPFRLDIPASYLLMSEKLSCQEILKVFVIHKHFNRVWGAFEVVAPLLESSKDSQELFVMGVIILFSRRKGAGVESNRVYFTIVQESGKDSSKSIVQSIHFYNELITWSPVDKNQGQSESPLECLKHGAALAVKVPRGILAHESS